MARRKVKRASTSDQACAIGFAKARAAGKPHLGGPACGKERKFFRLGRKSPRKLILPKALSRR